jgi:hypothetical protein
MILIIRGHIRNSFESTELLTFIKSIYAIYPELKIYIHTWNIISNNISWRHIQINNTTVTEKLIYNYFNDLKHLIKHIIIDDDKKIELIGNLKGNINNGPMPIIGWKNYWYGKYKIIDYIFNTELNDTVINCRFDILNNSNIFNRNMYIHFIKNIDVNANKNMFLFDHECDGIDNIYAGNVNTMYKLCNEFFYKLDEIISKNKDTVNQEKLVYRMNNILF